MAVLGIESSAHTFGAGVVENGAVLSNAKAMYNITSAGMIPSRAAELHSRNAAKTVRSAMRQAGLGFDDINAIGYTRGPGIGHCLRVGMLAAKTLSSALGVPLYPINHALAHIEVTRHLSGFKDPLALYVSGGNSQILGMANDPFRHYSVYGETFDIGVGNMLDNFARAAHLNPSWGSSVAKLAEGGHYIRMPYTVKGMDFTFTGLLTSAVKMLAGHKHSDVAFSLQETAFAMLVEATERAMLLTRRRSVIACGGVAQSVRLTSMLRAMVAQHKSEFFVAPNEYNADNGAMIALVAEKMHKAHAIVHARELNIMQRFRVDSARVWW
ncbi:tRNA (adenosine(37)-N6)-threonylcarbamoyltransferase complex transferase subunit TsaD [Candidatus Marsarchaeota archaeon]|nr:tRNA (adenosine(37)-N6)-threonylcarbamoyltransferase complex transferase subunit TsaD [Candidatus Marsarchaeota archaeon]MCL5100193.1 tRNA (adenosine(37)-N6)-threonylcarbamoyltransferase complex transferase subunit TsaD [Candidatus Marsarchaeota archaeon]